MGDHRDRCSVGRVQIPEEVRQRPAGDRVEVARRLVGEEDRRPTDERAGDRDALALAARQLAGPVVSSLPETDPIEGSGRGAPPLGTADPAIQQAIGDVGQRRFAVEEMEVLEDEPDPPGAES